MIALASARAPDGAAGRLAAGVAEALSLGFRQVHASAPATDAGPARRALDAAGVALTGVDAPPDLAPGPGLAAAVESAAALRARQVVLEGPDAPPGADGRERGVDAFARLLHATLSREPGLRVAVRHGATAAALLGPREVEWLLSELRRFEVGLWLDPWRSAHATEGAGPSALDWADRLGARVHGISLHGEPAGPGGPALPSADAVDWRALREAVPAGVARVLDVGPRAPAAAVVEWRRRLEESLGW